MIHSPDISYAELPSTESAPTESKPSEPAEIDSTKGPFTCKDCDKQLLTHEGLRKHKRVHTKPIECPLCPKEDYSAAQNKDLHRHLWTKHPIYARKNSIPRERGACLECNYEGRRDNVRRHRQNHHCA